MHVIACQSRGLGEALEAEFQDHNPGSPQKTPSSQRQTDQSGARTINPRHYTHLLAWFDLAIQRRQSNDTEKALSCTYHRQQDGVR